MSLENLQKVSAVLEGMRGTFDGAVAAGGSDLDSLFAPDWEFVLSGGSGAGDASGLGGTYVGREGFQAAMTDWLSAWEPGYVNTPERIIEAGDGVLVLARERGRTRTGGVEMEVESGTVWSFSEGLIVRIEAFQSRERAIAAAGPSADITRNLEGIEPFNRALTLGEPTAFGGWLDPEVVYQPLTVAAEGRLLHGIDAVREYVADRAEVFDEVRVMPRLCFESRPHRVVLLGRWYARGVGSGAEFDSEWAAVTDFRDGLIIHSRAFGAHAEALAAADRDDIF